MQYGGTETFEAPIKSFRSGNDYGPRGDLTGWYHIERLRGCSVGGVDYQYEHFEVPLQYTLKIL